MAYKVHTVVKQLPQAYPKIFSSAVGHKDGTATAKLRENPDLPVLLAINKYLEEEQIYVVHFQITHHPRSVKYGRNYTLLADNFRNILLERQRFIPNNLGFDDPIVLSEAALLINVHIQYARRLTRTNRIHGKKSGGIWYVSTQSVVDYRVQHIREVLFYEYGTGADSTIELYLNQPVARLPITQHVTAPILAHYAQWLRENEELLVRLRRERVI